MSQGLATGHLFWASLMCYILLVISKIRDLIKFSEQLHKMTQITLHFIDQEVKVQRVMETPRSKSELRVQYCSKSSSFGAERGDVWGGGREWGLS